MPDPLSHTPYLGLYLALLAGGTAVVLTGELAVIHFTPAEPPSGAFAILPPIFAALSVGGKWALATGAEPESARAWRLACVAAAVYTCVRLAISGVSLLAFSASLGAPPGAKLTIFSIGAVLVTGLVVAFANRWFLSLGARYALWRRGPPSLGR